MFVVGIAGIIVTSIVNNNNGLVITFGAMMTLAAIVLIAVNAVTSKEPIDVFDEARAEQLEARIGDLVAAGADEAEVRALVATPDACAAEPGHLRERAVTFWP